MRMRSDITAILILGAAVAAIVVVMFATGWADDKAPPGSGSRGGAAVSVPSTGPTQTTK
jgi:hypothetical protein